jgi:hypothetical protein
MTCRQCDDLTPSVREKDTGSDEEPVSPLPGSRNERGLRIALRSGLEQNRLSPECACRRLEVFCYRVSIKTI